MLPNMGQNEDAGFVHEPINDTPPPPPKPHNPLLYVVALMVGLALGGFTSMKATGVSFGGGGGGDWVEDLDAALDEVDATGKNLLVYYTADWCPPCKQLKRGVLKDSDVQEYLAEAYVRCKIDLTNRAGANNMIAAEYDVYSIPTMIVYDPYGNEVERVVGKDIAEWLYERSWY